MINRHLTKTHHMKTTKNTTDKAVLSPKRPRSFKLYQAAVLADMVPTFLETKKSAQALLNKYPDILKSHYKSGRTVYFCSMDIYNRKFREDLSKSAPIKIKSTRNKTVKKRSKNAKSVRKQPKKGIKPSANDYKHIVPVLTELLNKASGPEKGVNNQFIQRFIKAQVGVQLDRRTVQIIIRDIRLTGLVQCLIGDNQGYYIATTPGMAECYKHRLVSLIKELSELLQAFNKQARKKFKGWGTLTVKSKNGAMPATIKKAVNKLKSKKKEFILSTTGKAFMVETPHRDIIAFTNPRRILAGAKKYLKTKGK